MPLLAKYSWPALISMTLNALYAVVDRFYIAHGCGTDAMAALTLAFPVMMLFGAFGVFIGLGHSAIISIKLGEGNRVACEKALGELVALKLIFFTVIPLVIWCLLDKVLQLAGAGGVNETTVQLAHKYLSIILVAQVPWHLSFGLAAAMRAEGAARRSMWCMVVGFGINLLLDPLFIFVFKMGVAGAAWATNVAMLFACAWALWYYIGRHSVVRLRLGRIHLHRQLLVRTSLIGIGPFLQQFSGAAINFSMAAAFALWAHDAAAATRQIAALGIFQVVMILFLMPTMGVQQGLAPIIGYNWGARNFLRVREALRMGFVVTTVVCTLAAVVQIFWPTQLARLFASSAEPQLIALAAYDLRLSNCMLWCIGLNVVATTYFQSIGHPFTAIILSLLRQVVCLLPCVFILPYFFPSNPEFGIWLALPVSDILAFLATIPPIYSHLRFLKGKRKRPKRKDKAITQLHNNMV